MNSYYLSESHYTDNPDVDVVGEIMRVYCDQEKWSNFCKLYPTEAARRNLFLNIILIISNQVFIDR